MPFCCPVGDAQSGGAAAPDGVGAQLWGTLAPWLGVRGARIPPMPAGHSERARRQPGRDETI